VLRKDVQFNVRMSSDEVALVKRLAEAYGVSSASVIRMLVRQAAASGVPMPALAPVRPRRKSTGGRVP
jgi:hypothetical protein